MRSIVLATQKGGSGKSTIAIGLAIAATQEGQKVVILDTDPQATVANWASRRTSADPKVIRIDYAFEVERSLCALAREGFTLCIVDTAAGADRALTAAVVRAADICLLPTRPTIPDIEATQPTLLLVRRSKIPFAFILTQTGPRYEPSDHAAPLSAAGALALPFIASRNDHQNAVAAGLGVTEFAPNGKAAREIGELWAWVKRKLESQETHDRQRLVA